MCHALGVTCSLRPTATGVLRQQQAAANGAGGGSDHAGASVSAGKGSKSMDDRRAATTVTPSRLLPRPSAAAAAAGSAGSSSSAAAPAAPRGSWASPLFALQTRAGRILSHGASISGSADRNSGKQPAAGMIYPSLHTITLCYLAPLLT